MQLTLHDDLLLIPVTIAYRGRQFQIPNVVVDTSSATTMISTDVAAEVGITPDPQDILYVVHGIGGTEVVFSRHVDHLRIGARAVKKFEIEVGKIDATFDIDGILGLDFLLQTSAILNLGTLQIDFA